MARSDKVATVAELTNRFSSSAGVVLTEYRGLSVKALMQLRRSLEVVRDRARLQAMAQPQPGAGRPSFSRSQPRITR